jgi:hypothetical protein
MSWAFYSGDLTQLSSNKVYDGARATAMMFGINGETTFRVSIRGLGEDAVGNDYGAHLHTGPCGLAADGITATVGPHYNTTPAGSLPVVSDQTEVWLNFHVSSDGNARDTAVVPFVPTPGENGPRSITFHALQTDSKGIAGAKLACLPLDIKKFNRSD